MDEPGEDTSEVVTMATSCQAEQSKLLLRLAACDRPDKVRVSATEAWAVATAALLLKEGPTSKKPSTSWTRASAALRQTERKAKMAERAAALEKANREAMARDAAAKEKEPKPKRAAGA
jgi:hypothetical protein